MTKSVDYLLATAVVSSGVMVLGSLSWTGRVAFAATFARIARALQLKP
jgi:hypothetical protein